MSSVLYYSNYCEHCKELLQKVSKSKLKEKTHFINIDNRTLEEGAVYIILQNGQKILLPPNIQRVPALLLLNKGNNVVVGKEIEDYLIEKQNSSVQAMKQSNAGEPMAFGMGDFGSILSDNFSFLDQGSDEMSAKGHGGMRQIHNYATLDFKENIDTPPDNYVPDKVGDTSLQKLQEQRSIDVPKPVMRM